MFTKTLYRYFLNSYKLVLNDKNSVMKKASPFFLTSFKLSILLGLLFSTLSCSTSTNQDKTFDQDITGKVWQLRYISENGLGVGAPPIDTLFSIRLNENGSFGSNDHCNACGGAYETDENGILFSDLICTLAVCPQTKTNIQLANELNNVTDYQLVNSELQLSYNSEGVLRTLHFADANDTKPKKAILAGNNTSREDDWESGSYDVEFVSLTGDTLTLKLGYSGCDIKDVNMVFSNYFLESIPVQAHAFLPQINQACLAYFEKEYQFDLSPLKNSFNESYQSMEGIIDISIREKGETLERFLYEF